MTASAVLDPAAASPLYVQVQRRMRGLIQEGAWKPGSRLPAVPDLADRFQVHRLTVLKALAGLKRTGWVQTVHGRGSFVPERLPEAPGARIPVHDYPFEGWTADRTVNISKTYYLYIVPAQAARKAMPTKAAKDLNTEVRNISSPDAWPYRQI